MDATRKTNQRPSPHLSDLNLKYSSVQYGTPNVFLPLQDGALSLLKQFKFRSVLKDGSRLFFIDLEEKTPSQNRISKD